MFISDRALEHLEKTAEGIGFGGRDDYPHVGRGRISAGDWKGASIASCVFADVKHAHEYLRQAIQEMEAMGGDLETEVHEVVDGLYVATITCIDMCHKDDFAGNEFVGQNARRRS